MNIQTTELESHFETKYEAPVSLRVGHTLPGSSNGRLADKRKCELNHPLLSGGENRNSSSRRHPESKYETHKTHNDRTTIERVQDK